MNYVQSLEGSLIVLSDNEDETMDQKKQKELRQRQNERVRTKKKIKRGT